MSRELANPQKCVVMRNGCEIWLDSEKAEELVRKFTEPNAPQFITYGGRMLNRADLVGVFLPSDMEEMVHRKNGGWKCRQGSWHDRGEKCECRPMTEKERQEAVRTAVDACSEESCKDGYVWDVKEGVMKMHDCMIPYLKRK